MRALPSYFRSFLALALLVFATLLVTPVMAEVRDITNTAHATWTLDDRDYQGVSNPVTVTVIDSPPDISVYVPGPDGVVTIGDQQCGAGPGTGGNGGTGGTGGTTTVPVRPADVVRAGQDVIFSITLPSMNRSPTVADTVAVTLTTNNGDREILIVTETGPDTAVFAGRMETVRTPPAAVQNDCRLSLTDRGTIIIAVDDPVTDEPIVSVDVPTLVDPLSVVFDSETGEMVSGAKVTLIDTATGQPARVTAEDGVTAWPSTIVSGTSFTDGAGHMVTLGAGEYWFPRIAPGNYVLRVELAQPYITPSTASIESLAKFVRPDGAPMLITDGSFARTFAVGSGFDRAADIPVDRIGASIAVTKTASRPIAQAGDTIFYTITVTNPDATRAKRDVVVTDTPSAHLQPLLATARINGEPAGSRLTVGSDTRTLIFRIGDLAAGATTRITYGMAVGSDNYVGFAENRARAEDSLGRSAEATASVRVERDQLTARMTIVGRITAGDCSVRTNRVGIPGIRVMMEDGSFAITDRDGRYHFNGVAPGSHVVQVAKSTLPAGQFVDCTKDLRSAGNPISRLVTGHGGTLAMADFHAVVPADTLDALAKSAIMDLAGATPDASDTPAPRTDYLALGDGPNGFLAPAADENPAIPAITVAVRHRVDQTVRLTIDGKPVDRLLFEGTRTADDKSYAVSQWRGVHLSGGRTAFAAEIRNANDAPVETFTRDVYFTDLPASAELVEEQSRLLADGRTAPVVAVRLRDRAGRPLRAGVAGEVMISAPYESAEELRRQQINQLARVETSGARWLVQGNDGIALIELAPTMTSGALRLEFQFTQGRFTRRQKIETWINPGKLDWTVVGLVEASAGEVDVADQMERKGNFDSDLGDHARVAIYAKGPIGDTALVTVAYDSAKDREDQVLGGTLDPRAYYTIFADGAVRRYDAASRDKVYGRVETNNMTLQYGDFETRLDDARLTNYHRAGTGVSAEARLGAFGARAYAAEIGTGRGRDELQGEGVTGPYPLSDRLIIPNSEKVWLETRDRYRSEIIISRRELVRFADYSLDLLAGTITFKEPILSRDFDLNPQFIVIEYESAGSGKAHLNAGGRVTYRSQDGRLRAGATFISDSDNGVRTAIAGADVVAVVAPGTEIRGEVAMSKAQGETNTAWLVEARHQSAVADVVAYAKSVEPGFGIGQQNEAEVGRRKIGVDASLHLGETADIAASVWQDDDLTSIARRRAVRVEAIHDSGNTRLRAGVSHFNDRLADGSTGATTLAEAGVTQRDPSSGLELSAGAQIAIDGKGSQDLPSSYRVGARLPVANGVRLAATYERTDGKLYDSSTVRAGVEVAPWLGGLGTVALGRREIAENGSRDFMAYGLSQSWQVNPELTLDASIDGNHTFGGTPDPDAVLNPSHPPAAGGQLGSNGTVFEDFTAVTLGAAWRRDLWSATARAEWRDGEFAKRMGVTAGLIRQLGNGSTVGAGGVWTRATGKAGGLTEIVDLAIAAANRPANGYHNVLAKLEYRSDRVEGTIAGELPGGERAGIIADGNAQARRLLASLSFSLAGQGRSDAELRRRISVEAFLGGRYNFDAMEGVDVSSFTLISGWDARVALSERLEAGISLNTRNNFTADTFSYSFGPQVGFTPTKDVILIAGYNINGFDDPDFRAARYTSSGFFITGKIKLDANSFAFLGLNQ